MSEKITSSQIYLFLAKQDDWKEKADANHNGEIVKGEMREYLSSSDFENWSGVSIKDVSADVFNKFWASIDANVNNNKLDGTELEKMNKTISNYEKVEQVISENAPNGIVNANNMASWNSKMAEALLPIVEGYSESCGQTLEELLAAALPAAYNKATAEVLADQYASSAAVKSLISGAGIDYNIAEDKTLSTVVNNYIKTELLKVGDNDKVTQLGAADLKTAGLGDGGNIDVKNYGYDASQLNDVQKSVILKKISDKLSTEKSKFAGYEKEFDGVLDKFVSNYLSTSEIKSDNLFDTLVSKLDEIKNSFTASKEYKNLENTMNVYKKYRDNLDDTFKTAVRTALGDNADLFLNNCKTSKDYESVLQSIIERINSGDESLMTNGALDWTKVQTAIIEEITSLVNGAAGGTGALDSLQKDFERNSSDLAKAKEKAIKYCDSAKAMGGDYEAAVVKVFGADHKTAIEAFEDTIALASKMKTLFNLIGEIFNVNNLAVTKWNVETALQGKSLKAGQIMDGIDGSVQINSDKADKTLIEYSLSATSGGEATINSSTGKLSLKAGNEEGFLVTTITVKYDGKVIGTKKISIEVTPNLAVIAGASSWASEADLNGLPGGNGSFSDGDGGLRIWGGSGAYNDSQLNNTHVSFADLYNGNYNIELGTSAHSDGNKYAGDIANRLYNLGYAVVNALAGQGLDKEKLTNAMKSVTASWAANIKDAGKLAGKGCNKGSQRKKSDSTYNKLSNGFTNGSYSGITRAQDTKGNDQKVYMINFKQYVDAILTAYYAA